MRVVLLTVALVACGGGGDPEDPSDDGPQGACGEISEWDLTLTGRVLQDGQPAAGAEVRLEEEAWHPGGRSYGTTTVEADGTFELALQDVVSVEDCWGIALSYVIYANLDDRSAQRGINAPLFTAIDTGSGVADMSDLPLELQ